MTQDVKGETLDIPDEIAPAVVPYLMCLLGSAGIEIRQDAQTLAPSAAKGADCSTVRSQAARNADLLLKRGGGKSAKERRDFVERTLVAIETFPPPGAANVPEEFENDDAQD